MACTNIIHAKENTVFFCIFQLSADYTFTSVDGRTLEAEIIEATESSVTIRRVSDGRRFTLTLDRLIPKDAVYIREWSEKNQAVVEMTVSDSATIGDWPRKLKPDNYDITIVREDNDTNTFIYRTPHFEFQSNVKLARKVVREFSQIFESTLLVIAKLPLEFNPEVSKDSLFLTQIFDSN